MRGRPRARRHTHTSGLACLAELGVADVLRGGGHAHRLGGAADDEAVDVHLEAAPAVGVAHAQRGAVGALCCGRQAARLGVGTVDEAVDAVLAVGLADVGVDVGHRHRHRARGRGADARAEDHPRQVASAHHNLRGVDAHIVGRRACHVAVVRVHEAVGLRGLALLAEVEEAQLQRIVEDDGQLHQQIETGPHQLLALALGVAHLALVGAVDHFAFPTASDGGAEFSDLVTHVTFEVFTHFVVPFFFLFV